MTTALLFPGQGSQTKDMCETVERHAPELAELAIAAVGSDPFEQADAGTRFTQPAIVCASLAAWAGAGRPGADFFAGHSLGELTALAAAGSIDPADAVRLSVVRGRAMQDAASDGAGGMIALLGDADRSREVASGFGVKIVNDNGPTQLVAAGPIGEIDGLYAAAKASGVRSMKLAVAGAFHTEAISPAVAPYRAALEDTAIRTPSAPTYSSQTARPFGDPASIRDELASAITHPVRWRETLDALHGAGVRTFVEAGPGKALTGMVKRALDDVDARVLTAEEPVGA